MSFFVEMAVFVGMFLGGGSFFNVVFEEFELHVFIIAELFFFGDECLIEDYRFSIGMVGGVEFWGHG